MFSLLPAVLPVGLIILIGFVAGRNLPLQKPTLSQLTLYVLSPALVIDSLYRTNLSLESSVGLLSGFVITSSVIYLTVKFLVRFTGLSPSLKTAIVATSLFPNNGNMGLPVVDFALGAPGLSRAIVYMIGSSILMFCFGPAIIKGEGIGYGLKLITKLPLLWAIITGISLRLINFDFPFQLDTGIEKVGATAIPIALILLGMQLASTHFEFGIKELCGSLIRLLVAPAIAYVVGINLNLDSLDLQVLVLQSAMPTAVNSLVLVSEFGGDQDFVAKTVVTSTLLSFITLPLILWLLR
ncbi:MAG: AEC family transporter [Xenococcaceae cyanobacterium MO_207.B15]|nr:AEC family transporter [Xenococcaceae cyanobacterium MO_207.B15]